jgi:hypothetical protein
MVRGYTRATVGLGCSCRLAMLIPRISVVAGDYAVLSVGHRSRSKGCQAVNDREATQHIQFLEVLGSAFLGFR